MRVYPYRLALPGLALASAMAWSGLANAADAKQVADALVAAITAEGENQASYEQATQTGTDVTITGLKITNPTDGGTVDFPSLVIVNPVDREKGGFSADRMTADGARIESEGTTVTWATAALDQPIVPSPEEIKSEARILPFSTLTIGGLNIAGGELAAPVDVRTIELTLGNVTDGIPLESSLSVQGINLPAALFENDPEQKAQFEALGYSGFVAGLTFEGSYAPATDTITFRTLAFEAENVGKLTIAATVSGAPLSKFQDAEGYQEVLATAKVEQVSVRFENTGIVERVLDMQAKEAGQTREQFAQQMAGAMPLMISMMPIGAPAFQEKVAAAVAAFLVAPKSLTVASAPDAPVPLIQIVGAAMSAPQTLADILVIEVRAND